MTVSLSYLGLKHQYFTGVKIRKIRKSGVLMSVLSQRFQIRAYFDFGNGEKFSRTVGNFETYPLEARILGEIIALKEFYEVCKFEYAQVEKIYILE